MVELYEQYEGGVHVINGCEIYDIPIPAHAFDLWTPLIGIEAIGVYGFLKRLGWTKNIDRCEIRDMAAACRIGDKTFCNHLETLKLCGLIKVKTPNRNARQRGEKTIIKVLDVPRAISEDLMRIYCVKGDPSRYKSLVHWFFKAEADDTEDIVWDAPKIPESSDFISESSPNDSEYAQSQSSGDDLISLSLSGESTSSTDFSAQNPVTDDEVEDDPSPSTDDSLNVPNWRKNRNGMQNPLKYGSSEWVQREKEIGEHRNALKNGRVKNQPEVTESQDFHTKALAHPFVVYFLELQKTTKNNGKLSDAQLRTLVSDSVTVVVNKVVKDFDPPAEMFTKEPRYSEWLKLRFESMVAWWYGKGNTKPPKLTLILQWARDYEKYWTWREEVTGTPAAQPAPTQKKSQPIVIVRKPLEEVL